MDYSKSNELISCLSSSMHAHFVIYQPMPSLSLSQNFALPTLQLLQPLNGMMVGFWGTQIKMRLYLICVWLGKV